MKGADTAEQMPDLLDTEHGRQALFILSAQEIEGVPVTPEHVQEDEANPSVADPHRVGRPLIDVLAVEDIVLQLFFCDAIRGCVVELGQHAYGPGVRFLGALAFAVQVQGLEGLLVPVCHHDGLLS